MSTHAGKKPLYPIRIASFVSILLYLIHNTYSQIIATFSIVTKSYINVHYMNWIIVLLLILFIPDGT